MTAAALLDDGVCDDGVLAVDVAEGLRARGTVIVVPGRGETPAVYRRFGARLAADAYQVRVLTPPPPGSAEDTTRWLVQRLSSALCWGAASAGPAELVRPLVLVGADLGAVALAALLAEQDHAEQDHAEQDHAEQDQRVPWWPDAVVLAGLPGYGGHELGAGGEAELDARTHCPVHRDVLTELVLGSARVGRLSGAVDEQLLDRAYGSTADVPQLIVVGDADPLADLETTRRAVKALPLARLVVVSGGHHDVLNDLQHRSVAAEIVGFLEGVRGGVPLRPLVRTEVSAW